MRRRLDSWPQGYAPTKHRVKLTVKTDLRRSPRFGWNCSTIPNLPLGGPGRSIKGTGALTEFAVEAAPADAPDEDTALKFVRPRPTSIRRKRRWNRSSTTRAGGSA